MSDSRAAGIHPAWWTLILLTAIIGLVALTSALFSGTFKAYVPVTLVSDRAGLVMQIGSKVKMRGVQVGRVSQITNGKDQVSLKLDIYPDQIEYIPANVGARIRATTLFSAKYVDLVYPTDPSQQRLAAGTVITSESVDTEVNTVFQTPRSVAAQRNSSSPPRKVKNSPNRRKVRERTTRTPKAALLKTLGKPCAVSAGRVCSRTACYRVSRWCSQWRPGS